MSIPHRTLAPAEPPRTSPRESAYAPGLTEQIAVPSHAPVGSPIDNLPSRTGSRRFGSVRSLFIVLLMTASCGLIGYGLTVPDAQVVRIADMELGMRVAGQNADRSQVDLSIPDVDPDTWRQVDLHMTKENGAPLSVSLLRPLDWIEGNGASISNCELTCAVNCLAAA